MGPNKRPDNLYDDDALLRFELLGRIHASAIIGSAAQHLSQKLIIAPSNYTVFNLSNHQHTLFNFNLDGLAARYCNGHNLLHPHGILPAEIVQSDVYKTYVAGCFEYGGEPIDFPGCLLPQVEPHDIAKSAVYRVAEGLYRQAKAVVLIGYSFGSNASDNFDDHATYRWFIDQARHYPKPIILIDPKGDDLACRIQHDLKQEVSLIKAYWHLLSLSMMRSQHLQQRLPEMKEAHRISTEFLYQYYLDALTPSWFQSSEGSYRNLS